MGGERGTKCVHILLLRSFSAMFDRTTTCTCGPFHKGRWRDVEERKGAGKFEVAKRQERSAGGGRKH